MQPFKIYRNKTGWPKWYQPLVECYWILTGKWSLHKAWQKGLDLGRNQEYTRIIQNMGEIETQRENVKTADKTMTTKNIQDVVAELVQEFKVSLVGEIKAKHIDPEQPVINADVKGVADWLTDTLTQLVKEERERIGEELMRRAEGEKMYGAPSPRIHNQALDTMKQHITNVTGVE